MSSKRPPLDEIVAIQAAVADLLANIAAAEHHVHSRWRVYPQDITSVVTLMADAAANTFGNWTQIIPIDTVPFEFDIIGLIIETVSAATCYHLQIGYNIVDAIPPANYEMGERRFPITTVPPVRGTELLEIASQNIPANAKVWGRVKTASTNADTCVVSVVLDRHIETSNPVPLYPAFPW